MSLPNTSNNSKVLKNQKHLKKSQSVHSLSMSPPNDKNFEFKDRRSMTIFLKKGWQGQKKHVRIREIKSTISCILLRGRIILNYLVSLGQES